MPGIAFPRMSRRGERVRPKAHPGSFGVVRIDRSTTLPLSNFGMDRGSARFREADAFRIALRPSGRAPTGCAAANDMAKSGSGVV